VRAFEDDWVYYLGSFSKILAPSLRAGWVVVPASIAARLSPLKHAVDLDTPSLSHRIITAYLETGSLSTHLETLRGEYRRRRDAMLSALGEHLPSEVRWSLPISGMFVWVELPEGLDASELLRTAVETESVAFSPGVIFCSGEREKGRRCLRLAFTNHSPERITEGVRRLGRVIQQARGRAFTNHSPAA
jgi:2-aminoadipate transaminase